MQFLVFVGAAVTLVFNIPYFIATIRGRVRPNKISWLLWTIAPGIGFFASITQGFTLGQFPVLVSVTSTALVLIASFVNRKSYWGLTRFDLICGAVSLTALVIWYFTRNPALAIIFAMASDFLAAIPTLTKSWRYPETEIAGPYLAGVFNAATAFFAVTHWDFVTLAFPCYLLAINALLALVIGRHRLFARRQAR